MTTKRLTFSGGSDDIVSFDDGTGGDEIDCYGKSVVFTVADEDGFEALRIQSFYEGSWAFTVHRLLGDFSLPDWPVTRGWERYSETLEIEVPASVTLAHKVVSK